MANTVKIRNSSTAAAEPSSLEPGELAINTADGTLFWEDSAGSIQTTYLQPNLGDLADVSDTVPSPNTSVYVLANKPGVGWSSQGTIGSVSVGSEPLGGWPSGSVGDSLDGKASTSHASSHATGGSDAIAPADIDAAPAASPTFTGVITVSAGSAAAPAIVASGDSNTGIAFPAADTAIISTGGVERVRVDSSGRVGIGTTSPAGQLELERASNADYAGSFSFEGAALQISDNSNSTSYPNASAQLQFKVGSSGIAEAWIAGVRNSANVSSMAFGTQSGATRAERVRIKSTGAVRFVPLASDPATGEAGDVYYNSTTNKLRVYNGTSWIDLH